MSSSNAGNQQTSAVLNELWSILKDTRKHLMTGVSYMLPVVVAGGILFSLAVVLSGEAAVPQEGFPGQLAQIGIAGLTLFVPFMAAYIGYSIADRPGIAPGLITGWIAQQVGAGFIGAIIGGLVAGIVAYYMKKIRLRSELQSIMPIFVIPVVTSFIGAGFMIWVVGAPLAAFTDSLRNMLEALSGGALVVYAAVHGMMTAFDLGGPVNKTAWTFSMAMMERDFYLPNTMQAIGAAVPPLATALAVVIAAWTKRKVFNDKEERAALPSFLMFLVGITEGAIPFAATDPIRVIPSLMLGSAVGCVIGAVTGVEVTIPWDSLPTIPGTTNVFMFLLSILIGAVVAAVAIVGLKKPVGEEGAEE